MISFLLPLLCLLIGPTLSFLPSQLGNPSSRTHTDITREAILLVATTACKEEAQKKGMVFNEPNLDPDSVFLACLGVAEDAGPVSTLMFREQLNEIINENIRVDDVLSSRPEYHFNDEVFGSSRDLIVQGLTVIRASMVHESFPAARQNLGQLTHTLQDFYSHTNWFELNDIRTNPNLLRPDQPLGNIADINTPTCRSCDERVCPNLILPEILSTKTLTSGYVSSAPAGKCNHGTESRGGISKDFANTDVDLQGMDPHLAATVIAQLATVDMLQDLRVAFGNDVFLRMLGITRSAVVCFVVDTTGSMRDDIAEVRRRTREIIDKNLGTLDEPSLYILVEFNDPDFGPVRSTTDPDEMKRFVADLKVQGGGDDPELSFTGIKLALTTAPPLSKIFVFTDAPPKDFQLLSSVASLIETTKSQVSFLLTNGSGRRRRSALANQDNQLYEQLAKLSGGQAIVVSKATLPQATAIIEDSITSSLVTLLQTDSTRPETFSFLLDSGVQNVTLYITGQSITFTLQDPSGISQNSTAGSGPLGSGTRVGNLHRVSLNTENRTGSWSISIRSPQAYSLRIRGRSRLDFMFQFVRLFDGPHPGFSPISARPPAGENSTIQLTVFSAEMLSEVKLGQVSADGKILRIASVMDLGGGSFLTSVTRLPDVPFTLLLMGQKDGEAFQRQSSTQIQASQIRVQVPGAVILEPGSSITVSFTVETFETEGTIAVHVRDDQNLVERFTERLNPSESGSANGSLSLKVPESISSGSTSVVTVEASQTNQSNFAILRVSVIQRVTDFTPPVCRVLNESLDCPLSCSNATWEVTLLMSDGNGTGLQDPRISTIFPDRPANQTSSMMTEAVKDENGNNATLLTYRDSCCVRDVEISAVDREGNVGRCVFSIRRATNSTTTTTATTTFITTTTATTSSTNKTSPPKNTTLPFSNITSESPRNSTRSTISHSVSINICTTTSNSPRTTTSLWGMLLLTVITVLLSLHATIFLMHLIHLCQS